MALSAVKVHLLSSTSIEAERVFKTAFEFFRLRSLTFQSSRSSP